MLTRDDPDGCWLPAGDDIEERVERLLKFDKKPLGKYGRVPSQQYSRNIKAAVDLLDYIVAWQGIVTIELLNRAALRTTVEDPQEHWFDISIEVEGVWRFGRAETLPLAACRALLYGSQGSNGRT